MKQDFLEAVHCTSNSRLASNVTTTYYHATCTTYHDVCQSVAEFFSLVHSNLHCHFTRTSFSVEDFQNQQIGVFTVRISRRCEYYKIIMRATKTRLRERLIIYVGYCTKYEHNNALHTWLPAWRNNPSHWTKEECGNQRDKKPLRGNNEPSHWSMNYVYYSRQQILSFTLSW